MSVTSVTFPVRGTTATVRWRTLFSSRVVRPSNGSVKWTPDETVGAESKSAMSVVMCSSVIALIDALRRPPSC